MTTTLTQIAFSRKFNHILLFLLVTFLLFSCSSSKKLIGKTQTEYGRIKFYSVSAKDDNSSIKKVYADVDSNGTRIFYSFYPDIILKTEELAKQVGYRLLFDKLPENYNKTHFRLPSSLDTLVFSQAEALFRKLGFSHLKKLKGAEGFSIEVFYMHGFPKNKKFQPL